MLVVAPPLWCISYCSLNVIPPKDLASELCSMLVSARAHNARNDISGMLAIKDGCFIQTLEGPMAALKHVMSRIKADARHAGLVVYQDECIDKRRYGAWSMALFALSDPLVDPTGVATQDVLTGDDFDDKSAIVARIDAYYRESPRRLRV